MFLLDSSSSINFGSDTGGPSSRTFENIVLPFISEISRRQSIGPGTNQARVGVATFDTEADLRIPLKAYFVYSRLRHAIFSDVPYDAGVTKISLGLELIRDEMLNAVNGARPPAAGVPRVLVVITDGEATYGFEPGEVAAELRANGVLVFAIGVGAVNVDQLRSMASEPVNRNVLQIDRFGQLTRLADVLADRICRSLTQTPTESPTQAPSTRAPSSSPSCSPDVAEDCQSQRDQGFCSNPETYVVCSETCCGSTLNPTQSPTVFPTKLPTKGGYPKRH